MLKIQRILRASFPILFNFSLFLLPNLAFADGGNTPVGEGLSYLVTAMYGPTGIAIATLSIIAVGLLCLGHVLEWKRLIQTVIGIGIIFGAGVIVNAITALVQKS